MKKILKFYPLSLSTTNGRSLIITILIYLAVPAVFSLITVLFSKVLIFGAIITVLDALFILYCFIGIIIAVLKAARVIK